jgi:Fe-S oxidoreductase/coenzyme F420-reducing hydrogenase delta subunit
MQENFKIILFLCNWGPHVAYQKLQDQRADIPLEIQMVRIPCSGRITKALLFKSFEMGADGVILMGCTPGSCRYGTGTEAARQHTEDTRQILNMIGLGEDRLELATFLPDQSDQLLDFLKSFVAGIQKMGKSPITPQAVLKNPETDWDTTDDIVGRYDVFACQDCGKCTSACPLALAGKPYSPRFVATEIIAGRADSPEIRSMVNSCLTCGTCYERCPSAVNFPDFIKDMRSYYHNRQLTDAPAHGGFFQSMMRAMTSENLVPKPWQNLPGTIRTASRGPVLFFGGCWGYFDIFFGRFLNIHTRQIIEDSLRLLNFFDIEPMLLENERCCGHDLLWSGDRDNFLRLAKLNAEAILQSGAQELITACPECAHSLGIEYARHGIELPVKVTHIHEFLEREIEKGAVGFKPLAMPVTFQDACRQSRLSGQAELPRKLLKHLCDDNFPLIGSQAASTCCGNCAWVGCDAFSKAMQVKRLEEVRQSQSQVLITACPKCQIHLKCAMDDVVRGDELETQVMDLTCAIAKSIYWK